MALTKSSRSANIGLSAPTYTSNNNDIMSQNNQEGQVDAVPTTAKSSTRRFLAPSRQRRNHRCRLYCSESIDGSRMLSGIGKKKNSRTTFKCKRHRMRANKRNKKASVFIDIDDDDDDDFRNVLQSSNFSSR